MSRILSLFGLLALIGATWVVSSAPASAEFFGCNDRRGQVLYSYSGTPDAYMRRSRRSSTPRYSSPYSNDYSARPRARRHATYSSDTRYWNGR